MTKLIAAVVITAILSSATTALATGESQQQPSVAPEQIDRLVCPAGYVITEEYGCVTPDELKHDATFWQNMQDGIEARGHTVNEDGSVS